jgi:hypothetical protein
MNEKIAIIKTQKYLNEYSFLRNDEECILNLIDEYKEDFLKIVNQNYVNVDEIEISQEKSQIKEKDIAFPSNEKTLKKIKIIYREIAKICHPDKTKIPLFHEYYIEAEAAYNMNNLLELYLIAKKINIKFFLDTYDMELVNQIITSKRKKIKSLQDS